MGQIEGLCVCHYRTSNRLTECVFACVCRCVHIWICVYNEAVVYLCLTYYSHLDISTNNLTYLELVALPVVDICG